MKWIRYEILLPLCYNDGRRIESDKFWQTTLDLLENFSATTLDLMTAIGAWKYQGTVYEDLLWRFIVDVPASSPADDFFHNYKETLKVRFQQIDIWISRHEVQILCPCDREQHFVNWLACAISAVMGPVVRARSGRPDGGSPAAACLVLAERIVWGG